MNGHRLIAVDPGRTTLGIAIFDDASLRYFAIKMLRVPGTPADVRRAAARLLSDCIAAYRPTHMAIEQPLIVQQRAELLAHVISELKTTARRHGLVISQHSPQAVRRFICQGMDITKRNVAQQIVQRYPELLPYISTRRWTTIYYEKMFGAVALGIFAEALLKTTRVKSAGT